MKNRFSKNFLLILPVQLFFISFNAVASENTRSKFQISNFKFQNFELQTPNPKPNFLNVSPTPNQKRINVIKYSAIGLYPISMYWLYTQWYQNYPQSSFHLFNDNEEWLQMDKGGHMFDAYSIGKPLMRCFQWAGLDNKRSTLYGAGIAYFYQTSLEVFDGFSTEWGFSLGDIAMNTIGTGVFVSQQLAWKEQRITLKYSFHQTEFAKYRPNLLGKGLMENILKDYNGLTYWACVNPRSFMKSNSKFPRWLSFAFGYGAEGMTGGNENPTRNEKGESLPSFNRHRQYYLSLDFDLSRVQTKSKFLHDVFNFINIIRLPAPAIEFNNGGKAKFYGLYF